MNGISWIDVVLVLSVISGDEAKNVSDGVPQQDSNCLCNLGAIEDCSCNVDTVEQFNNMKLFPRLKSLLRKDYFRFYKVNLHKACPFWKQNGRCSMPSCNVKMCLQEEIPPGLRTLRDEEGTCKDVERDLNYRLGNLNTTISADTYKGFELWQAYDVENYALPDEDADAQFVDLVSNPERFTGYKGFSANRIWRAIYQENCFWLNSSSAAELDKICVEKRTFYRIISGLHASISVHLSANYLFTRRNLGLLLKRLEQDEFWGPNPAEFNRRFSPQSTNRQGPSWLKNLYFVYLVELRAVAKASPYLQNATLFTGNAADEQETKMAVLDALKVVNSFTGHFNESALFGGEETSAVDLKREFRKRFRNVTRIMDCVGCQKCKLWGKLQARGLGTALKILFSGKFDDPVENLRNDGDAQLERKTTQLSRGEIVSLFNALGRLSYSIYVTEHLKQLI